MGTPRETLRLVRDGESAASASTTRTGVDHTDAMDALVAAPRRRSSQTRTLCGYVLKKDSPSCGMERVKVYGGQGMPERNGRGLFAAALLTRFPNLPVEEEGRLSDPRLRENFIERVFAYRRLRGSVRGAAGRSARWSRFHTAHKMSLLAHSTTAYQRARPAGRRAGARCRAASCATRLRDAVHGDAGADRRRRRGATPTCCSTWPDISRSCCDAGVEARAARLASTTTAAAWCRWSCR